MNAKLVEMLRLDMGYCVTLTLSDFTTNDSKNIIKRPICVIYFTILIENERYRLNIYSKYELRITRKFNCVAQHTITSVAQHMITKGQSLQF